MFSNRLKLGPKRKQSLVKAAKLTLANEKADLENLENQLESDPTETTEVIKSTPNIQMYSPRLIPSQSNHVAPFTHRNRQPSHPIAQDATTYKGLASQQKQELAEAKAKIEDYKSMIQNLINQKDALKNREKILQAELNNCSKDYYERQISRLKVECENYQIEGINSHHKNQILLSQKSQIEACNKKLLDQTKNYLKQIEREKLTIVQLKSQLGQKDRTFKLVLDENQRSNELLARNQQQLIEREKKLENELKEKAKVLESLSRQNEILNNRFKESNDLLLATRKKYEELIQEKENKIVSINDQHRLARKHNQDTISKLNAEIEGFKQEQASKSFQINRMSLDIKSQQENMEKSLKIERLSEQLQQFKFNLEHKDRTLGSFQKTLKDYYSPEQYQSLEKKCKELEDKRLASAKYYEEKLFALQKENEKYRFEKLNSASRPNVASDKEGSASFNDILKRNIEENTAIKEELRLKIEQNGQARAELLQVKLKEKRYINDIEILTKKLQSKDKNSRIEMEVEQQEYLNEIDSLKRKLHTTETRLDYKISENKQKDDFIKNTIIGRGKPSDVRAIINELERIFLEREKLQIGNRDSLQAS